MSLRQLYRDKMAEIEKQGIQQGIQQGKQEGKLEGKLEEKLETVSILRQLGLSVEEIATRLELPLEDVIKASNSQLS